MRSSVPGGALPRDEVEAKCQAAGAPYFALQNVADPFVNRQFRARRNLIAVHDPVLGDTLVITNVLTRLSEPPGEIKSLGPMLGQHKAELLEDLLDHFLAEIEQLHRDRIV